MSRKLSIAALVLPLSMMGCSLFQEEQREVVFEATVAGNPWTAQTNSATLSDERLYISSATDGRNASNFEQIRLSIDDFNGVGSYQLVERLASYEAVIGGDGLLAYGRAQGDADDQLRVTDYDAATQRISGEFRFTATVANPFGELELGESFEVRGRFEMPLEIAPVSR